MSNNGQEKTIEAIGEAEMDSKERKHTTGPMKLFAPAEAEVETVLAEGACTAAAAAPTVPPFVRRA